MRDIKSGVQWSNGYKPHDVTEMIGQKGARAEVNGWMVAKRIPSVLLITGSTGIGKSSMANAIANTINEVPKGSSNPDHIIHPAGDLGGKDDIREIIKLLQFNPRKNVRIVTLEEVHGLTPQAAKAFLTPLEKVPAKSMVIMTTDQPERLPKPLLGRCQVMNLVLPSTQASLKLFERIIKAEKAKEIDNPKLLEKIADLTRGNLRLGVQLLQTTYYRILGGDDPKDSLKAAIRSIGEQDGDAAAIKALLGVHMCKPLMALSAAGDSEDKMQLVNRMLDLSQFLLDQTAQVNTYRSPARLRFMELYEQRVEDKKIKASFERNLIIQNALIDLRIQIGQFLMPENYLVPSRLAKIAMLK